MDLKDPPSSYTADSSGRLPALRQALLRYADTIDPMALFPVVVPQAVEVALGDPYAFMIATCLDRGTKADIIWTIPDDMRMALGHLDPYRIAGMPLPDLTRLIRGSAAAGRGTSTLPRARSAS